MDKRVQGGSSCGQKALLYVDSLYGYNQSHKSKA